MKIKLIEPLGVSKEIIEDLAKPIINAGHEFTSYETKSQDAKEQKERIEDADIAIIANSPLSSDVIRIAKQLRYISVAFAGIDHVGEEAVKEQDIQIKNAAGYCDDAVAELALGLTLGLLRNVLKGDNAVRSGGTIAGLIGNELRDKTVGIVGTGRIGERTAELFKAFKCNVIAYSRRENVQRDDLSIQYMSLEDVMSKSDVVSLHVPLNSSTKGIINKELIDSMKSTALLVNVARGAVVDNSALALALNENRIAGAGIDVFDMEPPIPSDYPLLSAKNTILTPHVAYATDESIKRRASIAFENVYGWLKL